MSGVPVTPTSPVFFLGAIALLFLVPARLLPAASPEMPGAFAPPQHCAPPGKGHAVTKRAFTGATWREVLVVDPDARGPLRAFDPELWLAPDGRLLFFWAQMDRSRRDTEHGVWCIETPTPDAAEHATFPRTPESSTSTCSWSGRTGRCGCSCAPGTASARAFPPTGA